MNFTRSFSRNFFFIPLFLFFIVTSCAGKPQKPLNKLPEDTTVIVQDTADIIFLEEKKIPSFEAWCQTIPTGAEIEVFELSWPSDDRLCDSYQGSDGGMSYRIYRLKESKKIVKITQYGYFCQGDSEYGWEYYFDENENVIYSSNGHNIYTSTIIHFYQSGIPVVELTYPASEETADPHRTITQPTSKENRNAKNFTPTLDELKKEMKDRVKSLKALTFKNSETESKEERDSLVKEMEQSLQKPVIYEDGYMFRKPTYTEKNESGENAFLNGIDIRVREKPNTNAKVLAKVSYYNPYVSVIDIGTTETIAPFGTHAWYKVGLFDDKTWSYMEGWVFGAFIAEGIYPVK